LRHRGDFGLSTPAIAACSITLRYSGYADCAACRGSRGHPPPALQVAAAAVFAGGQLEHAVVETGPDQVIFQRALVLRYCSDLPRVTL